MKAVVVLLCLLGVVGCSQLQKEAGDGLDNVSKVPGNIWKSK